MKFIDEIKQLYNKAVKDKEEELSKDVELEIFCIESQFKKDIKNAAESGDKSAVFPVKRDERREAIHCLAKKYGLESKNDFKLSATGGSHDIVVVSGWAEKPQKPQFPKNKMLREAAKIE